MKKAFTISVLLLFACLAGCSKNGESQKDAAFQAASDELIRLKSVTDLGLTYEQYCDRLLTAKGNIDVALEHTHDEAAKSRINKAFALYVAARNEWKAESENAGGAAIRSAVVRNRWNEAGDAATKATEYAFADGETRLELDKKYADEAGARAKAELKAQEDAATAERARQKEELQAEEQKRAEEALAQDRERARRSVPDGTGFNIKLISVTTTDTITTIPPGTELRILGQNSDGTLHVQKGELTADVAPGLITNDRDLAASLREDDQRKQEALRQWHARQAAAAAKEVPTPPPAEWAPP